MEDDELENDPNYWEQTFPASPGYHEVELDGLGFEWSVDDTVYSNDDTYSYTKLLICGGSATVNAKVYGIRPGEYSLNASASLVLMKKNGTYIKEGNAFYEDTPDPIDADVQITVVDEYGNTGLNFGNRYVGKISGHKFKDNNRNKDWDEGEPGLSGWTIKLYSIEYDYESGNESPTLIAQTETDSAGYYEFVDLPYGIYRVEEEQQSGWTQTAPDTDENPGYYSVFLDGSDFKSVENLDFGNYRRSGGGGGDNYGSISGHKYNDLNGNGEWDDDEPALSGWTIKLSNGATDITDENGFYSFTRLPYGTYTVSEEQQEGWTQTAPESFVYTVDINKNNEDYSDLNFGNEEESEIIIPPAAGPEPAPVVPQPAPQVPLDVKVTPKRVPAGDPTIRVIPGPDTVQVYALLPDDRKLELKPGKDGVWQGSFMVAFGTADGPYPIEVYAVDKSGFTRQATYTITIDNSLPLMEIKKTAQPDGKYLLEIKPLFNAVAIDYYAGANSVKLSRTQKGRWSAVVPAGDGIIKATDESGYQVEQPLLLPVIPVVVDSKAVAAGPDARETVAAVKNAVVNPESAGTETGTISYRLYLWAAAVAALVIAAAVAIPARLRYREK